ncbi:hypothetical protein T09_7912, partial [Trichinella sp. T9]
LLLQSQRQHYYSTLSMVSWLSELIHLQRTRTELMRSVGDANMPTGSG